MGGLVSCFPQYVGVCLDHVGMCVRKQKLETKLESGSECVSAPVRTHTHGVGASAGHVVFHCSRKFCFYFFFLLLLLF